MTRRLLSRCGHWVFAMAAALLFAGCATLPDEAPRTPTKALAVSADTALGKIATSAAFA
jgi:putative cardiolipin synthase